MVNRQIKTCRKKRHVRIDNMKEMPNLICSNAAVGGNFKSTRDTFASRLCEHETNIKVIQEIMGHADVSTTMNIYAEVNGDVKKLSIEALSKNLDVF